MSNTIAIKRPLTVLCAMAVVMSAGAAAANSQTFVPVSVCDDTDLNAESASGVYLTNFSTTTGGRIHCGVGQDGPLDTNDDLRIYFEDNNNNTSGDGNFSCIAHSMNDDLSTFIRAGFKLGCATNGGCEATVANANSNFAGSNYIELLNVQHGDGFTVLVNCGIPPNDTALSKIKSLVIEED